MCNKDIKYLMDIGKHYRKHHYNDKPQIKQAFIL